MARSRFATVWLPVVGWGAGIFALSFFPSPSTGLGTWDTILRKGAHITEYAVLGALLYRALGIEPLALAVGIAYAATDELHQHFVHGRHASPIDVAIDGVGLSVGMLVCLRVPPGRKPSPSTWQPSATSSRSIEIGSTMP